MSKLPIENETGGDKGGTKAEKVRYMQEKVDCNQRSFRDLPTLLHLSDIVAHQSSGRSYT